MLPLFQQQWSGRESTAPDQTVVGTGNVGRDQLCLGDEEMSLHAYQT